MLISNFCEHSNQTVKLLYLSKIYKHTLPLFYILNYYKIMLRQKGVKKKKVQFRNKFLLEVSELAKLCQRLKDQRSFLHAQHAGSIWRVCKYTT